ncbi:MAG: transposase [Bacteroidetes bacterium]|nr:transposase [Bacteroidota bacterium]
MDNHPVSCHQLGRFFQLDGKQLQQQYKHHISDYPQWDQRDHASEWMVFEQNMGPRLSIDETALSNDELYTVVTNKAAKGQQGAIVAMIKGTQAEKVIEILQRIPERLRKKVEEVTLDMAASMNLVVKRCFPHAHRVIDRFHVQQLAGEAVQEMRIKYRWEALDQENEQISRAKQQQQTFQPEILSNGDTLKQLLARSRYLLFKHKSNWTPVQKTRAGLLFERYPRLKQAYDLSIRLSDIFKLCTSKQQAFKRLALWYNDVEASAIDAFRTVSRSIQNHYLDILNFFNNRSTNASAESFNAKIKAFRASARGVRDISFFLFRLSKIYV